MKSLASRLTRRRDRGQTLVLFVFFLILIILIMGLSIDLGFAYVTKASLSKAVDAAALAGIKNIGQGTTTAGEVAAAAFAANYGRPGRDLAIVEPNVVWSRNENNNIVLDVDATATVNTFFIRILPQWKTLAITARSQATRTRLIVSLVLDWSGSMFTAPPQGSGGALNGKLTSAVSSFVDKFDDSEDRMAMAVFGSVAQLKVPIQFQFKDPIKNALQDLNNLEWTFADGGLNIGLQQVESVKINPGDDVLRVIVFFTDGFANTFQTNFAGCGTLNLAQDDPFKTSCSSGWCPYFLDPSTGSNQTCGATEFQSIGGTLGDSSGGVTTVAPDTTLAIATDNQNVWTEGQLRALATANAARGTNVLIYSIGLGQDPTLINKTFLKQIANVNDPDNPTFNENQPVGVAAFAPTADDLQAVFDRIAADILLRLTR